MAFHFQLDGSTFPKNRIENPPIWSFLVDSIHQSVLRVVSLVAVMLPGLIAFLVSVILMALLGAFTSYLVKRILVWRQFDERMQRTNASVISEWSPRGTPSALVGRIIFWIFVLCGMVIGVLALDASYASGDRVSSSFLPIISRYVGAGLLVIAGSIIARFLARSVLIGAVNYQLHYARFLSVGVKWLVLVLTGAMALDHLGIGGNIVELAFGILFGGIVLTLALAVGLGSRDLVSRSLERTPERNESRNDKAGREGRPGEQVVQHF